MTITQIDLNPRADNAAKIDTLEIKNDPSTGPSGPGFGQVMNQLRQAQQDTGVSNTPQDATASDEGTLASGQEMAAGVQDMSLLFNVHNPEMDSWSLKAVNLGPTLNVITPEQAAPDAQRLEAFARSQGLDETAVQWLMGSNPVVAAPTPMTVTVGLGSLDSLALVNAMNTASQSGEWAPLNPDDISGQAVVAGSHHRKLWGRVRPVHTDTPCHR